jgi:ABC-2 type transport system permease protein
MKRPSHLAVLGLFLRTALRRNANRSAAMSRRVKLSAVFARRQKPVGDPSVPSRTATAPQANRVSRGRRWLDKAFATAMVLTTLMLCSFAASTILDSYRLQDMRSGPKLPIWPEDYARLQKATCSEPTVRPSQVDAVLSTITGTDQGWIAQSAKKLAEKRFEASGLSGFEPISAQKPWRGALAALNLQTRLAALKTLGLFFLLVNLAATCLALGLMNKSLANDGPDLIWLFQFPVSRPVLFVAKLLEYAFDNPIILIVNLVLSTVFLMECGCAFAQATCLATLLALTAALSAGAVRLAAEVWMLDRCSRKSRSAIISLTAVTGSAVMMFLLGCANSQPVMNSLSAASHLIPDGLLWSPFSLGFGPQIGRGLTMLSWLPPLGMSAILCGGAIWLATTLTSRGLACRNSTAPRHSEPSRNAVGAAMFRGVVLKELLQMRRRPGYVIQILVTPVIILAMLYAQGFQAATHFLTGSAGSVCAAIFAGTIYLLSIAASQTLAGELKTLWFLQCQPRSLADSIRTKARVWGAIGTGLAIAITAGAATVRWADRWDVLVRVPAMAASTWLLAEVVFGSLALGATIVSEQRIRFRSTAMFLPLLIGADAAKAIYDGSPWQQIIYVAWLLALRVALRQKQLAELGWLSEPVESPPKKLDVLHGLIAVLGFLSIRDFLAPCLASAGLDPTAAITGAYCGSSLLVSAVCWSWLRRNRLSILPTARPTSVWRPLVAGLLAACCVAIACVPVMREFATSAGSALVIWNSTSGMANYPTLFLVGMVVIVAPLFEEWIFRGMLYQSLRRSTGIAASVALTTLLFAAIHPLISCIGVVPLGITTAIVAERTKRLWPSIAIHMAYNAVVVAMWNLTF